MPEVKISGVTVSHIFDDGSISEYKVKSEYSAGYITLQEGGHDIINIYHESWPEIRDQIQLMLDLMRD